MDAASDTGRETWDPVGSLELILRLVAARLAVVAVLVAAALALALLAPRPVPAPDSYQWDDPFEIRPIEIVQRAR